MVKRIALLLFIGLAWGQNTTIAVLEFDGKGVSQSETSTLSDRLRNELFNTGIYNVLERGLMDDILKEQGFQQTGCTSSECAVEVGNMLGVQQMVGGSIGKVGNIYTISARVIDVQTGEVLKSANYDHNGDIGQLLIKGMKQLAYDLSGNKLVSIEPEILVQKPKNNISSSFIDVSRQAKLDAVASTSPLWYVGGLIYYVGIPAFFLIKPRPNALALSKIPNEEQQLYMARYKTSAQKERGKRMGIGCGCLFLIAMAATS